MRRGIGGPDAAYRSDPGDSELGCEPPQSFFAEAAEHDRGVDRGEEVAILLEAAGIARCRGSRGLRPRLGRSRLSVGRAAVVELADLQHVGDRSDPGDRFLGELANAECQRPQQLPIHVDGAAAHARDHPAVFGLLTPQAHQDDVALGAVHVPEHTQDLDLHRLRLRALEYGVSYALHAGTHLVHGHQRSIQGSGAGRFRAC